MKKCLLLLSGFLILTAPRLAQAQAPPVARLDSAAAVAREDTAIALQRLFFQRRRTSRRSLILEGVLAGAGSYVLATGRPETTYQRVATAGVGVAVSYYAARLLLLLARQRRYRPSREKRLLAALSQGQSLPARVRRQLTSSYFGLTPTN